MGILRGVGGIPIPYNKIANPNINNGLEVLILVNIPVKRAHKPWAKRPLYIYVRSSVSSVYNRETMAKCVYLYSPVVLQ